MRSSLNEQDVKKSDKVNAVKSSAMEKRIFLIISIFLIITAVLIGPADYFTHGYFCDEIDVSVASADLGTPINLTQEEATITFRPIKKHFAGFEIYMTGQTSEDPGYVTVEIKDSNGGIVDTVEVPINKIKDSVWYKVYTNKELKVGTTYSLSFSAHDATTSPSILTIDTDYLGDEIIEGNGAIVFAYEKPTFSISAKTLLILFILSIWLFLIYKLGIIPENKRRFCFVLSGIVFLTTLLSWNFMFNSFDNQNSRFSGFQADSETLVTGTIRAEEIGTWYKQSYEMGYGLGRYQSTIGSLASYGMAPLSDGNWNAGYSRTDPIILVSKDTYTSDSIAKSTSILFANGDSFDIATYEDDGTYLHITLATERILNPQKYGSIEDIRFVGQDGWVSDGGLITAYDSQYGLQGKIYRRIARLFDEENEMEILNLINAIATAVVLTLIVILLGKKYNKLFAGTFYVVFMLSPWVVNFARNLYWVEFTWFIPMLIGLFCSLMLSERKWRIVCYAATYVAIVIKCLCGYEYISAVMLGLISFLLVDFVMSIIDKNKENSKFLFRTIFIIGIIALCGFATAICIHALIKGAGDLMLGIKKIIENDVLRRTNGANLNDFDAVYWPSMNASIWEVFCTYFKFSTEVIAGITGNLFPVICSIPIAIFAYDYYKKRLDIQLVVMYIVFFLVAVSWFSLAKSHSYIHTHMNYVLWYMGFIQVCLYAIVRKIVDTMGRQDEK